MTDSVKLTISPEADQVSASAAIPLIFISHDGRDAELAEAFSKLLKSVSAGMIRTFRSSDKKGTEGFDFGEEWYRRLMDKLQSTTDVVCLFTERSLDRPWILFEAGVAKGKLSIPVIGVALGVPLGSVTTGPFYQFQNMEDSEDSLTKLVNQLARRVPGLELDNDVVRTQVAAFKTSESAILSKLSDERGAKRPATGGPDDSSVAKLVEEIKALPARVVERMADASESPRRRRGRGLSPSSLFHLMQTSDVPGDPIGILMAAGLLRDEFPWLYDMVVPIYEAVRSGDVKSAQRQIARLERLLEGAMREPASEGFFGRDSRFVIMEFSSMLRAVVMRSLEEPKTLEDVSRVDRTQESSSRVARHSRMDADDLPPAQRVIDVRPSSDK